MGSIIHAEKSGDAATWCSRYNTGRFWHTVRANDGEAARFRSEVEAMDAARQAWWEHDKGKRGAQKR